MRKNLEFEKQLLRIKSILISLPIIFIIALSGYVAYLYITFDANDLVFATSSIKVYDKNNDLLWEISKDNSVRSTPIKLSDVPQSCVNAIVSVEDRYYWSNIGIDAYGIGRLLVSIVTKGSAGGGSTITQQTVKVSNQRIYGRNPVDKINEIVEALKLTSSKSKDDILEMYLNNVFFGNLNYGIESASQDYFKKPTKDLDLAECSYLAGIPQWPGVLNPYGDLTRAKDRQKVVLDSMVRDGSITQEEADKAFKEELAFKLEPVVIKAPHYVQLLSDIMQRKIETTDNIAPSAEVNISSNGEIFTPYDYNLHQNVLEITKKTIDGLENKNINNAAVVILDSSNNLITMIGSANYFDDSIDGKFNSALGFRQPGTALSPYIYSIGFAKDKDRNTALPNSVFNVTVVRDNQPLSISVKNLDSTVSQTEKLGNALQNNLVIPSVYLSQILGKQTLTDDFNEFKTLQLTNYPNCDVTAILEGCEKTLLDMTYFYSTLSKNGQREPITLIKSVKLLGSINKEIVGGLVNDSKLKIGLEITNDLLKQKAVNGWVIRNGDIDNYKDFFTFAYNDSYTIGIWAGNTKGTAIDGESSVDVSGKIASEIIKYLNK